MHDVSRTHVTIRDVAQRAGVSHQTVSRVLNGSRRVAPDTRARVQSAIEALNYRPNASARVMATGRTATLACIAPNLTDYTFANIIHGAEREAQSLGYFLLSASAPDAATFAALIDQLVNGRRVDGVLVINPYADERHVHLPAAFPVVFAGARPRAASVPSVALDDVAAARSATEHLISLGHQRIGVITGPMAEDCSQDRILGWRRALNRAGIRPETQWIYHGDWLPGSGYAAIHHFARQGRLPSAVFAQNDQMAVGAMSAARELGLTLPQGLSLIGVDDIPMAAYFSPPLTTLRQDFATIGRRAAQLLHRTIETPELPPQQEMLPAEIRIRASTSYPHGYREARDR